VAARRARAVVVDINCDGQFKNSRAQRSNRTIVKYRYGG
jgi:hypothetical protein